MIPTLSLAGTQLSGIAMFMCWMWCVMSVWRCLFEGLCVRCVMLSVCFVMLCAWKASVYLSKRINSSLLTKIFNGIRWEGCVTQRQRVILGRPLLFIVQWVIRNKAWFKHNYKTMWWMESLHDTMLSHQSVRVTHLRVSHLSGSNSVSLWVTEWVWHRTERSYLLGQSLSDFDIEFDFRFNWSELGRIRN